MEGWEGLNGSCVRASRKLMNDDLMSAYDIPGTVVVMPHGARESPSIHSFIHSSIHPSSLSSYFPSSFFPPSYLPSSYLPKKIYQVPINVKHKVVNKAVNTSKVLSKVVNTAKSLVALCSYISQDSIRRQELHSDFNRESLM